MPLTYYYQVVFGCMYILECKQLKDAFQLEVSQTVKYLLFLNVLPTIGDQVAKYLKSSFTFLNLNLISTINHNSHYYNSKIHNILNSF